MTLPLAQGMELTHRALGMGMIFLPQWIFSSVQFSHSVVSNSLQPHGLQHARPPCLSPTPGVYSNSCPLSLWCHPTILSTVFPFSSCLQSFPASRSFPMSQFLTSSGRSIGVSASASILPVNIQDGFPFGWTGWIFLQSKGFSRVFSNTTVNFTQVLRSDRSLPCWVLFLLPENVPPLYFKILFILLILSVLVLCCGEQAFSGCGKRVLLFIVVHGLLIAVASLVVEHGL